MRSLAIGACVLVACSGGASEKAMVAHGSASVAPPSIDAAATSAGPRSGVAAPAIPVPVFPFDLPPPVDRIVAISGTKKSNCVVRASGHVDCWGQFGGDETAIARIPEIADAIAVSVGDFDRCVHARSGVYCGRTFDEDGKLGRVEGLGKGKVIALAKQWPKCAVVERGIACWDESTRKGKVRRVDGVTQIAEGDVGCIIHGKKNQVRCRHFFGSYTALPQLDGAREITMGDFGGSNHDFYQELCAIAADGHVRCYTIDGNTQSGSMGVSKLDMLTPAAAEATRGATQILLEDELYTLVGGKVVIVPRSEAPRTVPLIEDAVAITPTCALRANGGVACWGDNASGALGLPVRQHSPKPVPVVGVADVVSIARTRYGTWAATGSGALYRWGDNKTGWAVPSPLATDVLAVASDPETFAGPCMLRRGGVVTCIDRDGVAHDIVATGAISLHVSRDTFVARLADGSAARWDWSGFGHSNGRVSPVGGAAGMVEIIGDASLTCRRDPAGKVWCAKLDCVHDPANSWWDCTDKTGELVAVPPIAEIVLYHGAACARTQAGEVWCWGSNYYAQTGHQDPEMGAPPRAVPGIADATGLSQHDGSMCAVRADGRLTCWGNRTKAAPHDMLPAGSVGAAGIVGAGFGCYIQPDRRAACWGGNSAGELGNGAVVVLDTPAAVPGL